MMTSQILKSQIKKTLISAFRVTFKNVERVLNSLNSSKSVHGLGPRV